MKMCFLCRHEDLSSSPRMYIRKLKRSMAVCAYHPCTGECRDRKILGAHGLASLACLESFRPMRNPVSKNKVDRF